MPPVTQNITTLNVNDHITMLDGLRGICAISVGIYHSMQLVTFIDISNIDTTNLQFIQNPYAFTTKFLMLVFNGPGAVLIFFVLSGFVSGKSFSKVSINRHSVCLYYARRLLRLYPVYAVILVLISLYFFDYRSMLLDLGSVWPFFDYRYISSHIIAVLKSDLLFSTSLMDPPAWALKVEIIGSIFLPLFYIFTKRLPLLINSISCFMLTVFSLFTKTQHDFHYLYAFYLGLLLLYSQPLFILLKAKKLLVPVSIIALIALLGARGLFFSAFGIANEVTQAYSAWILIGCLVYGDIRTINTFLTSRLLRFYGRISYSYYLLHMFILYVCIESAVRFIPFIVDTANPLTTNLLFAVSSSILATGVACICYYLLERRIAKFSYFLQSMP